jgi:hypothetical protein
MVVEIGVAAEIVGFSLSIGLQCEKRSLSGVCERGGNTTGSVTDVAESKVV